jgi:hypothetical protein
MRRRSPSFTSVLLSLIGALCLLQGLSKALLWAGGARAVGRIAFQENTVSSRGATWVRYEFHDREGRVRSGTAMTAIKGALNTHVQVAYLPLAPGLNMPAYGGYAALMGIAWSLTGLLLLGLSRLILKVQPRKP